MSAICDEARTFARHCEACGQFTTAERLRGLADWIDIQPSTIARQRAQIAELGGDAIRARSLPAKD